MIAHSLPRPAFGPAQNLHGATFVVEATWRRADLQTDAIVMDIGEATGLLGEVLDGLRYQNLDEHPDLAGALTTTEALAKYIADQLITRFDTRGFTGLRVTLREHPDAWADCTIDF